MTSRFGKNGTVKLGKVEGGQPLGQPTLHVPLACLQREEMEDPGIQNISSVAAS